MSSAAAQISPVVSFSYSFVLKWTLKGEVLKNFLNGSTIHSDLYQFKQLDGFRFFLEMKKAYRGSTIKGPKMWSFELVYGFLGGEKMAFSLTQTPQLSFLPGLGEYSHLNEEEYTGYFLIIASPASSGIKDDISVLEGQYIVDFEAAAPDITLPSNYTNKIVNDFIRKGVLPDFSVSIAIQIIEETEIHKSEALKILSVHYLRDEISAKNKWQILKAALDYGLKGLEKECVRRIAAGYYKIS